jgi:hypothetical protein
LFSFLYIYILSFFSIFCYHFITSSPIVLIFSPPLRFHFFLVYFSSYFFTSSSYSLLPLCILINHLLFLVLFHLPECSYPHKVWFVVHKIVTRWRKDTGIVRTNMYHSINRLQHPPSWWPRYFTSTVTLETKVLCCASFVRWRNPTRVPSKDAKIHKLEFPFLRLELY